MPDDPSNRPPPLPRQPYLRTKSTPPDGGLKSSGVVREVIRPPPPDLRDRLIEDMRRELESLRPLVAVQLEQETADTEPPPTRPSVRVRKARAAKLLGKGAFLLGAAPFIGAMVARKWPQYSDLVDLALQFVGLR